MAIATGTYELGPDSATLQVLTHREGVAAKVGHDLVLEVTRWQAALAIASEPESSAVDLSADPRSLQVREGTGGLKPLSDKDRAEIRKSIDGKVLRGQPIAFRSTAVRPLDDGSGLVIEGDLTIAGGTRAITIPLNSDDDGRVSATVSVLQSAWGIEPYRGLMGALKLRDEVEVVFAARLPAATTRAADRL